MKTPLALASAALLAATLAGCGGGDDGPDSEYCKDLKAAQTEIKAASSPTDVTKIEESFDRIHELADEAPSEIKEDWTILDKGITEFEKALNDAGLKPSDFADIQQGKMPEGVDMKKLQGLATELQGLTGPETKKANDAIEKHAKDVCKVSLAS